MTRQYQRERHLLKQINEILEFGMTQREVEEKLGLADYRLPHAGVLLG